MSHPAIVSSVVAPLMPLEKNSAQKAWPHWIPRWTKKPSETYRRGMNALFGKIWKEPVGGDSYDDGEGGTFILASSTGDLETCDVIIRIHPHGKEEIRQAPNCRSTKNDAKEAD